MMIAVMMKDCLQLILVEDQLLRLERKNNQASNKEQIRVNKKYQLTLAVGYIVCKIIFDSKVEKQVVDILNLKYF